MQRFRSLPWHSFSVRVLWKGYLFSEMDFKLKWWKSCTPHVPPDRWSVRFSIQGQLVGYGDARTDFHLLYLETNVGQFHSIVKVWKLANIYPIAKGDQLLDVNKDLRPSSLTSTLCKIAEDVIISLHLKPLLLACMGSNNFNLSPVHVLLSP